MDLGSMSKALRGAFAVPGFISTFYVFLTNSSQSKTTRFLFLVGSLLLSACTEIASRWLMLTKSRVLDFG